MAVDPTERAIIRVVAAAQFINVLEFVIVMPLGPDFSAALGIPTAHLPYIAASYTAAAAVAGIAGAFFLDRFDRKKALFVALCGLVLSTASAGLAHRFVDLVVARAMAGFFGGPATSLAFSIVADAVPSERRGRALSVVMMAFALASIFGLPAGLWLSRWAGWRTPFFAIAALGTVAVALTLVLPPLRAHLDRATPEPVWSSLKRLVADPTVRLSYAMTCLVQTSGFLIIPALSPYLQLNVHFPRRRLDLLYLVGGVVSLVCTRTAGRLVDRYGSLRIGAVGIALLACVIVVAFASVPPVGWVWGIFMAYMLAQALRNVSYNTLASKVPATSERARFQSLQSAVTHISISAGAACSGQLLSTAADGSLVNMPRLAWLSIGLTVLVPVLMWRVERRVNARAAEARPR